MQTVHFMGGLGNQLFQYASLWGVSRVTGHTPVIPGKFAMEELPLRAVIDPTWQPSRTFMEGPFTFDPRVFQQGDGTGFIGYWQTEKYFAHCAHEIREQFTWNGHHPAFRSWCDRVAGNSIAVHVRRGDYLGAPTKHPVLEKSWYVAALQRFPQNADLFVFCAQESREWAQQLLDLRPRSVIVDLGHDLAELTLMSRCRGVAVANSSFSWWAGWLNTRKDKHIIAPVPWFGPAGPEHDLYAQGWDLVGR